MSDDFQGSPAETKSSTQALPSEADVRSDAELLQRYVEFRDAAAFEQLVTRHQRMVMGVAFRILNSAQGAEDVFQETFFQLARLARSIQIPGSLAGWLHKVASNAALQMLLSNRRRMSREVKSITPPPLPGPGPETSRRLRSLVDSSLADLPEKYRMPVILCYLEGLTHEEAAARLGYPLGSMSTLLTRALELLRSKARKRGGEVGTALLLSLLCAESQAASPALIAQVAAQASAAGTGLLLGAGAQGASLALLAQLKAAAAGVILVIGVSGFAIMGPTPEVPWRAGTETPTSAAEPAFPAATSLPLHRTPSLNIPEPLKSPVLADHAPEAPSGKSKPGKDDPNAPAAGSKAFSAGPQALPDLPGTASERARAAMQELKPNSAPQGAPKEGIRASGPAPAGKTPPGWERSAEAARSAAAAARATQERAQQAAGKGKSGK